MKTTAVILFLAITGLAAAQDTISLSDCHRLALLHAPRINDREIIRQIGDLKVENAGSGLLPSLNINGKISYQSDVVTIMLSDPAIPVEFPEVPHDQYGLNLDISQTIYDGGITRSKKEYELASVQADLQQVEVDLYGLKKRINQLYFSILILQENRRNIGIHMDNLVNRREVMKSAVEQGTLLKADLKGFDVEILKVRQSIIEIEARKRAFLEALNLLCGTEFSGETSFSEPLLTWERVEERSRPEYRWFDLKEASMEAGKELISRKRRPIIYAFGQTGYGKPGYNMLSGEWDFYYMVGAGLRWNIWDWNSSNRERQVIEQRQQMLKNQKATFEREISTLSVQEESKIEQFRKSMELEEEVLSLQKEISENAATKLANGTITATDYITELNRESLARINLATQKIQLMQTIANYLTIQGNL
jgi:outer membrane protein TolC